MATPSSEREAWERLKDLALGADPQGFTALDFFTEVTSPGAHARVLARGWPIETRLSDELCVRPWRHVVVSLGIGLRSGS
jgi:hypothetical protein